ncbi:MAG: hypothetical protein Q8K36_01285 [Alphaproteobacteria bacterium]|nr:hypothetical protein [Alphaproteobacteria bacterium]
MTFSIFKKILPPIRNLMLCLSLCLMSTQHMKAEKIDFSDLTIIVNSCDKYEELWQPFFKLLLKHWPALSDGNIPIILITNGKQFDHPNVSVFYNKNEKTWSETFMKALEQVKTKYILYLQDDYFMTDINVQRLSDILKIMKQHNAAYVQLYGTTNEPKKKPVPGIDNLAYKNKFEEYRAALQAAFWEVNVFKHLLNVDENIWHFEVFGSTRSQGIFAPFMTITADPPLSYLNMAAQGHLLPEYLKTIKEKEGIAWETKLPVYSPYSLSCIWRFHIKLYLSTLYWDYLIPLKNYLVRTFKL